MFAEFVKRRDVEKIQTVLDQRQYDVDQTDDVCIHYMLTAQCFSIVCAFY